MSFDVLRAWGHVCSAFLDYNGGWYGHREAAWYLSKRLPPFLLWFLEAVNVACRGGVGIAYEMYFTPTYYTNGGFSCRRRLDGPAA